jgi:DhnA family fructose-bisphosphate aldolase class Ia
MIKIGLLLLVFVYPPKAELSAKFKDISIMQALRLAKTFGADLDVPIKLEGRIKTFNIEVRTHTITVYAGGFNTVNDYTREPVQWIRVLYGRKTREYHLKAEALGGLIEVTGVVPK